MDVGELARAAAEAPLVLRVREFLWWVGDRRRLSRERTGPAPHGRGYAYLSLGAWVGDDDAPDDHPDSGLQDGGALLDFTLAARMLEMVVEWRDRAPDGRPREHGWLLPGPGYAALPEESSRVWRTGVELLPVLWRRHDPRVAPRLAGTVPRRSLESLSAAGDDGIAVRALTGECGGAEVPGARFATVLTLLESLGLVRFDYTLDSGERCVLTPLGHHALTLLSAPGTRVPEGGAS
ncbi:hypothetical protein [Actinorugispora endophytica]|uniref:Uncharacterized protein n=1 Tax=Actinorugispora endophytica TaxID=1605990 RepID=A0A4R6UI58_9ACTN|nr:hypothetical protein [Actinorugispora endophytica]TDQ46580.1 hypothetical protein EV190_12415 [Actinorugispora endophytica]